MFCKLNTFYNENIERNLCFYPKFALYNPFKTDISLVSRADLFPAAGFLGGTVHSDGLMTARQDQTECWVNGEHPELETRLPAPTDFLSKNRIQKTEDHFLTEMEKF